MTDTIVHALQCGYRHIDTASYYGNEESVGRAIRDSGIARDELFVVTKLWGDDMGRAKALAAFERSRKRLGLDYVDLYLIHWPKDDALNIATWGAMEEIYRSGAARAIGVSNFSIDNIQKIIDSGGVVPACNQVELHPYLSQVPLCTFCAEHQIQIVCYSPLGTGAWSGIPVADKPISDAAVTAIATAHGVSAAQVILAWDMQHGLVPIPKAEKRDHIADNLGALKVTLTDEEMRSIDGLNQDLRLVK